MLKRPKAGETEEDLLRFQEEFLASRAAPAAKLIKMERSTPGGGDAGAETVGEPMDTQQAKDKDVVHFGGIPQQFSHTSTAAKPSPAPNKQPPSKQKVTLEDLDPEEAMEKQDSHITKVLTEIVEREFTAPVTFPSGASVPGGFPKVMHRGNVNEQQTSATSGGGKKKKKSLFAQQFAKHSPKDFGVRETVAFPRQTVKKSTPLATQVQERPSPCSSGLADVFSPGELVSGSGLNPDRADEERQEIHQENAARLAAMTQKDIMDEKAKLMDMLDPSLISYLQNRNKTTSASKPDSMDTSEPKKLLDKRSTKDSEKNSDLPIPSIDKKWRNMSNIEYDKLEWMKDVPPPKAGESSTGKAARFDFNGKLMSTDTEVPVHLGLHHHGDEPERAGYSLEELFTLARSANLQQRSLALLTVAKIISNAREGEFHENTSVSVFPALLDSGLLFIVRWALDDSTENPLAAAVACLHSILVCPQDEESADSVFSWSGGHEMAALTCPQNLAVEDDEGKDAPEETKKTDADLLKEDVIKGLLRMSVLPRLRYLLSKWRPAAIVVINILQILTRIARHSAQAAYEITQCSGLLECIITEFLPTTWDPAVSILSRNYGFPVSAAIKLIRVICTAGRHMAANMVAKHGIMAKLSRYIVESPSSLQLHPAAAEDVYVESLRTWTVLASYGLASQHYREMYEVLMQKLVLLPNLDHNLHSTHLNQAIALLSLLEQMTIVAAVATRSARQQLQQPQGGTTEAIPDINWSNVTGMMQPLEVCMEKCLLQFAQDYFEQKYSLSYPASCVNYVASYLAHADTAPGYNAVNMLQHLEDLTQKVIQPALSTQAWGLALQQLRECSMLLYTDSVDQPEQPANLPCLGSMVGPAALTCPLLRSPCTLPFVAAVVRLCVQVGRLHKGMQEKLFPLVLQHEELLLYLRKVCQLRKTETASNYFSKFENQLQADLLTMARMMPSCADHRLYHQVSISVMIHLHLGQEHIAHNVLSMLLFNPDFVSDLQESDIVDTLSLADKEELSSATQQTYTATRQQLHTDTFTQLQTMRNTYLTAFGSLTQNVLKSRNRVSNPLEARSLLCGDIHQLLVPVDWVFLPILELYNRASDPSSKHSGDQSVPAALVSTVTNTLRWVHLLEDMRHGALEAVPLALKLSRLLCTFLAGSDLFLDRGVHMYLAGLLRLYCKPVQLDRLDLSKPIPGMSSFYDLYVLLLEQYEAVSYGDSLFACYVLLPLQQKHDLLLRKAVWGEHATVLRSMMLPIKQVVIPVERFLEPEESHVELLRLYMQGLMSGAAQPKWCPLLYLVAVHHTNRFFYTQDDQHTELKRAMVQQAMLCRNKMLRQHLLYYKKYNKDSELCMELYEELPKHRQQLLDSVKSGKC